MRLSVVDAASGIRTVNVLPRPGPSLLRLDRAAVQLGEPLGQGQADAQPSLPAIAELLNLREHVEDARQHARRDARTGIGHGHGGPLTLAHVAVTRI